MCLILHPLKCLLNLLQSLFIWVNIISYHSYLYGLIQYVSLTSYHPLRFNLHICLAVVIDGVPWTPENDLLTPTMKLKRINLLNKYRDLFNTLYMNINNIVSAHKPNGSIKSHL